jgi:hypothetical protein
MTEAPPRYREARSVVLVESIHGLAFMAVGKITSLDTARTCTISRSKEVATRLLPFRHGGTTSEFVALSVASCFSEQALQAPIADSTQVDSYERALALRGACLPGARARRSFRADLRANPPPATSIRLLWYIYSQNLSKG